MRNLRKSLTIQVSDFASLREVERELVIRAIAVRRNAYAPYSDYFVGAALMSMAGGVYVGCNVERATYTQTTHAEQAAADAMVAAEGPQARILAMASVGGPKECDLTYPMEPQEDAEVRWEDVCPSCGHCLQIVLEHAYDSSTVMLQPFANGLIACTTIGDALPMRFAPSHADVSSFKR